MTSIGLVDQSSAPFFIPSNNTFLTFPNSSAIPTTLNGPQVGIIQGQAPVNASVQAAIYQAWSAAAIQQGLSGITFQQWGQDNLQPATPTQALGNAVSGTFSPDLPATQGVSPDDGYQAYVFPPPFVIDSCGVETDFLFLFSNEQDLAANTNCHSRSCS